MPLPTLGCDAGAGSLNDPNNPPEVLPPPFTPVETCVGTWQISGKDDECSDNELANQESYVAEVLNINGAPINVYKLLGVHEQGHGSILDRGTLFSSPTLPGRGLSELGGAGWASAGTGTAVLGSFIALDFGFKDFTDTQYPQNEPPRPDWQTVAGISITQANNVNAYARQVRVDTADGETEVGVTQFTGTGDGTLTIDQLGLSATQAIVSVMATSPTTFLVAGTIPGQPLQAYGIATVGVKFSCPLVDFTITNGTVPFTAGDLFTVPLNYVWRRQGVFNLLQTIDATFLKFQSPLLAKAVRVTPTMFTGTGSWEVMALDVLDSAPSNVNDIQDLFFNENRDRDYAPAYLQLKCQYSPVDSISDLSKFGLQILDQYSFTCSFNTMVQVLGRPIITGDIIEVRPDLQYDQNLKPVRKFLEVTDTGWAAEGYAVAWKPTLYRFTAQQALPSQETRDIFGTIDTQKYLTVDNILADGIGDQIDTTPLTISEEIAKEAARAVPEVGSDDQTSTQGAVLPRVQLPVNEKGNPPAAPFDGKQGNYIEDGLPPNGEPYGEGYKLPETMGVNDGDYFRLYYPQNLDLAPRLYRYSAYKNRWLYIETDRRAEYASAKPSVRKILDSSTRVGLGKKQV